MVRPSPGKSSTNLAMQEKKKRLVDRPLDRAGRILSPAGDF